MGQQQLLLLVIGVIVVALGVLLGIQLFGERFRAEQADNLLNRNVHIAQEAINWRGRAQVFAGGGGGGFDPLAIDGLARLGFEVDDPNGTYAIATASGTTLEIVGVSTRFDGVGAYVRINGNVIDSTAVAFDGTIALP
jgi:hypothetical protein